jgi:hypothetical protein
MVDQGGPEDQPCHVGGGREALGGGLGRQAVGLGCQAVGPDGPSHRSFARGVM